MPRFKKIVSGLKALSKKFAPKSNGGRRKIQFEALEKRFLLSADPVMVSQDLQKSPDLLPDLGPTIIEFDGQSTESGINAADSPNTEAVSTQSDGDAQSSDTAGEPVIPSDEGSAETDDALSAVSRDGTESQETSESALNTTAESDDLSPTDLQNTENVLPSATEGISPQAAYWMSKHAGMELIFIDPSVPDYESLLDKFITHSPDANEETQTSLQNDETWNDVTKGDSGEEEEQDTQGPGVISLDLESSSTDSDAMLRESANSPTDSAFEIVILDSDQDGLEQITETLGKYQGISAVHIISHGAVGTLRLGNSLIKKDELDQYASRLKAWQEAMAEGGDILLYGCNVAEGRTGIDFVERLSSLTGADVAASIDDTGDVNRGGDWVLEYSAGVVETMPLFYGAVTEYNYLLEDIIGTDDDDTLTGNAGQDDTMTGGTGDDIYSFQDNWGNDTVVENIDEGADTLDFSSITANLTFTIHGDDTISVTDGTNTLNNINNIENLIGGSGNDTLVGPDGGATWNLTGDNTGIVSGFVFSGIEDLMGSATGPDTFVAENKAKWSGTIDGGGGTDTLDLSPVTDNLLFTIQAGGTVSVNTAPDTWSALGIIPEEVLSLLTDGISIENVKNVTKLVGGSADNTFAFQGNASFAGTIDGGEGITNTLDYSAFTDDVDVNFVTGTATATLGIENMNRVVGAKDKLNVTCTDAGEETISFSDDKGVIAGILSYVGLDNIEGTPGNDVLTGNDGINIIIGKSGDDLLMGQGGPDTYMFADGWGADTIDDSGGIDILDFTMCTADLTFTIHTDGTVSVTDGTNKVYATDDIEVLIDGQGNDKFVFEDGATFNGVIGKPNWLQKLLGTSLLDYGSNTMDLSAYTTPVYVDLGMKIPYLEQTLFQQAYQMDDDNPATDEGPIAPFFHNISNVTGGSGDDFIWGSSTVNRLKGGDGDDVIFGRGGADIFEGGLGDDALWGGIDEATLIAVIAALAGDPAAIADQFQISPIDLATALLEGKTIQSFIQDIITGDENVVTYANATSAVTVDLGLTLDLDDLASFMPHSTGGDGNDTIIGIHNVIGSKYDDTLEGNIFDNTIKGGDGDDTIRGGLGSDTLIGGLGDDTLDGGGVADDIILGDRDIASYVYAGAGVQVDLNINGVQDTRRWIIEPGGYDPVGGLDEGREYEVVEVAGDTFKLKSRSGDLIDVTLAPPGGVHSFQYEGGSKSFSPSAPGSVNYDTEVITIIDHGFSNNQVITYDARGNDSIGGLNDGQQYKVQTITDNDNAFWLKDLADAAVALALASPSGTHSFDKEGITKSARIPLG